MHIWGCAHSPCDSMAVTSAVVPRVVARVPACESNTESAML